MSRTSFLFQVDPPGFSVNFAMTPPGKLTFFSQFLAYTLENSHCFCSTTQKFPLISLKAQLQRQSLQVAKKKKIKKETCKNHITEMKNLSQTIFTEGDLFTNKVTTRTNLSCGISTMRTTIQLCVLLRVTRVIRTVRWRVQIEHCGGGRTFDFAISTKF